MNNALAEGVGGGGRYYTVLQHIIIVEAGCQDLMDWMHLINCIHQCSEYEVWRDFRAYYTSLQSNLSCKNMFHFKQT